MKLKKVNDNGLSEVVAQQVTAIAKDYEGTGKTVYLDNYKIVFEDNEDLQFFIEKLQNLKEWPLS